MDKNNGVYDQLGKTIANEFDTIIFNELTRFGITIDNVMDFKDRIVVYDITCQESKTQEFYLDNVYMFTVTVNYGVLDVDGLTYKQTITIGVSI